MSYWIDYCRCRSTTGRKMPRIEPGCQGVRTSVLQRTLCAHELNRSMDQPRSSRERLIAVGRTGTRRKSSAAVRPLTWLGRMPVREKLAELDLERLGAHLEGFAQLIAYFLAFLHVTTMSLFVRCGEPDLWT